MAAQRAAAQDPYVHELAPERAVALRIGYGTGDEVADGKWSGAREIRAPEGRRRRTDVLAPQQHVAAVLGGRDELLACENLVLRARLDLEQDRGREAALQLRVGLEALLRELADATSAGVREDVAALTERRDAIVAAANAALRGELDDAETAVVRDGVARSERALRRRRASYSESSAASTAARSSTTSASIRTAASSSYGVGPLVMIASSPPDASVSCGRPATGKTSSDEPTQSRTSARSASAWASVIAASGSISPNSTTSGLT